MQQKTQLIFFDYEIITFELVALDTRFYWEIIHVIGCQYVNKMSQDFRYYYQRIFRGDSFSEWSRNITKILPWRFKESFGPFSMLTVHKCSDIGIFRHLRNLAICSLYFKKEITSKDHLLFQSIRNFNEIPEMQKKIKKIYFDFEIIAFELVTLETCFYWERILVSGCQYFNKQSQDFR